MNVKQVIKKTAIYFGRNDIVSYIEDGNSQASQLTKETVDKMVLLLNTVVSELCATFVPIITTEEIKAEKELYYSKLSNKVIDIVGVYDHNGNKVDFEVSFDHAKIAAPCCKVEYKMMPNDYTIDSEMHYQEKDISSSALAYGLAAEFALTEGDYDLACVYRERYVNCVYATKKMYNCMVKQRRWA